MKRFGGLASLLRRVNLFPRLVVVVSLGFLVLLGILWLIASRVVNDSRDRILQERLVIAQMAAREVDAVLRHDFTELDSAAASSGIQSQQSDAAGLSADLERRIESTGEKWLALYLLNADGTTLAAAPSGRTGVTAEPEKDSGFVRAIAAGRQQVSSPYVDAVTGRPAAMLTVPVPGTPLVLGGVIDLSQADLLGPLNDAMGLGKTAHAELFDGNGLVIASTEQAPFQSPGEHRQFYLRALAGGKEDVETVTVEPRTAAEAKAEDGDNHIMAAGLLSSAHWGVAVGGSEAETLAPVADLRNEVLVLGAVSLIVLWVLTVIGARLLVRPVRVLTGAADRIAAGDLETPISVGEGGEIGRLGETLDTMRARLKGSLEEIERRDRELEQRVEERTQQVQTLYDELQRKEEIRGRLLESVISAQEEERKRIARELHDETGQSLTGIIMSLEAAQDALQREPGAASQRLEKARTMAAQSIEGIRQLVVGLRPASLDDLGLVPALRAYAESRLGERGIRLRMETAGLKDRLSPPIETCLFRVVQEAVTNIVRHSEAKSAHIELKRDDGIVSLLVEDDGRGFDPASVMDSPDPARALGLAGMEERVALIGGRLSVDSAPGRGTRVQATITLGEEWRP